MFGISETLKESVREYWQLDPEAKLVADIEQQIKDKKIEIASLENELNTISVKRSKVDIKYRTSILWCLEVDINNDSFFLKNKEGLVKCVELRHKIKITPQQNNALGSVLTMMFNESRIGRIKHRDVFFYGLPSFFTKDEKGKFTILKKKYEERVKYLRTISI